MVALAIESGIAPSVWWEQDERDLMTALQLLAEQREAADKHGRRDDDEGVVTSG